LGRVGLLSATAAARIRKTGRSQFNLCRQQKRSRAPSSRARQHTVSNLKTLCFCCRQVATTLSICSTNRLASAGLRERRHPESVGLSFVWPLRSRAGKFHISKNRFEKPTRRQPEMRFEGRRSTSLLRLRSRSLCWSWSIGRGYAAAPEHPKGNTYVQDAHVPRSVDRMVLQRAS